MVLDSVTSPHSRRNYAKALDLLFALAAGRPLTRALLMEYRASMEGLAPSTVNVRLSAVRKLVTEARKNGMLSAEDAANLTDIPNVSAEGNPAGQLADEGAGKGAACRSRSLDPCRQARLRDPRAAGRLRVAEKGTGLAHGRGHPDAGEPLGDRRSPRQGRTHPHRRRARVGQERHQRLADCGRHRRRAAAALHPQGRQGRREPQRLGHLGRRDRVCKEIGIERFGAHDLRRTCAKLCRKSGGDLEQIKFLLGHSSIQTTERYLGSEQEIAVAVNDSLGL